MVRNGNSVTTNQIDAVRSSGTQTRIMYQTTKINTVSARRHASGYSIEIAPLHTKSGHPMESTLASAWFNI